MTLLILLTPYIVKDQLDLAQIRERKVREYREFAASFANLNDKKYEPKIDYRRKRGLVEEINRVIQGVEEDMAVLNASGGRINVQEGALNYGESGIDAPDERPNPTPPNQSPPTPQKAPDGAPPQKAPTPQQPKPDAPKPPAKPAGTP
jgi:hypothetical protein